MTKQTTISVLPKLRSARKLTAIILALATTVVATTTAIYSSADAIGSGTAVSSASGKYAYTNYHDTAGATKIVTADFVAVVTSGTNEGKTYKTTVSTTTLGPAVDEARANYTDVSGRILKQVYGTHKVVSGSGVSYSKQTFSSATGNSAPKYWFSQLSPAVGDGWNVKNLDKLYFPNCVNNSDGERTRPFYTYSNVTATSSLGHMNKWGCSVSSIAMIFKNMSATTSTTHFDFRTDTTANLAADPFTIAMANMQFPIITYNSSTDKYQTTSSIDPMYVYWDRIASAFGKTAYLVDLGGKTAEQKANNLAYYIGQNPEGIAVRINGHTLVFTNTTRTVVTPRGAGLPAGIVAPIEITEQNDEEITEAEGKSNSEPNNTSGISTFATSIYDSQFTAYDPYSTKTSNANNVNFENSWTYGSKGGIPDAVLLYYFN
ncbi:MAG: hypothetical protein LBN42_04345 [Oscillospiraceae bacterium]|jgi:hypothetical protein|nr:hypothetical protein [Oscillospiraceae bacterium]